MIVVVFLVAAVLFVFGLWVVNVWDQATDLRRHWNAKADQSLEDAQATKGTGSSL